LVVVLGAGYALWAQAQERAELAELAAIRAARDKVWEQITSDAVANAEGYMTADEDARSVHVVSDRLTNCIQSEVDAKYWELMVGYSDLYGAEMATYLYADSARVEAGQVCREEKEGAFNRSALRSRGWVVALLDNLGAPDSVAAQLEGLRGLDGSQEIAVDSDAGPLSIQARYDGSNGLDVVILRARDGD
jgi:hypothetical protein